MDQQPVFTPQDLFAFIIGDVAKAVCERTGESPAQQFIRSQAAAQMILSFVPRDVIEAVLAGHCVMLHETMTADVRTTLCGDAEQTKRRPRGNVVGLNRAFNETLDRLDRYQERSAETSREAPAVRKPETQKPEARPLAAGSFEAGPSEAGATPDDTGPLPPQPTETLEPRQPKPIAQTMNRAARRKAARDAIHASALAARAASRPARAFAQSAVHPATPEPELSAAKRGA